MLSLSIAKSVHADPPTYEGLLEKVSGPEFQIPLQRGDLTNQVNMERLDAFIYAFEEEVNSYEFQLRFPNVHFPYCWFRKTKIQCLTNPELDFANRTFHSSDLYGATDKSNQLAFDVGCSVIVQIISRVLMEDPESCLKLPEGKNELNSTIAVLDLMAKLRWKMQCIACPGGYENEEFYTLGRGENIYDPNPVDTKDQSDYLKSLRAKAKLIGSGEESESLLVKYDDTTLGSATIRGGFAVSSLGPFILCSTERSGKFCTPHSYGQVMIQKPLEIFLELVKENRPLDELKALVLSIAIGLNDSTTYKRGQGSLTLMLMRALIDSMGCRVTLVGKWHVESPFYPLVIDSLLFNYVTPGINWGDKNANLILNGIMPSQFIQDHIGNLLVQPLSSSTKEALAAAKIRDFAVRTPPSPYT